jgi:hypothetical protein
MFRFPRAGDVALLMLVAFIASNVHAQTSKQNEKSYDLASGVLLDRLSRGNLKTWQAIRQIIYSEDADGRTLHPKLRALFEQLETSEHTVYLEFADSRSGCHCTAGEFSLERLDPEGMRHVAVIKLFLRDIEHASARPLSELNDGFAPLSGLNKLDRYVEVFAHEMAHAVDVLFNQERANMVDEVIRGTDKVIQQRLRQKGSAIEPEINRALQERDAFFSELEKPAVSAEAIVWRELIESRGKAKTSKSRER